MSLLDRPVAAFDIETIPDPGVGRRILGIEGDDAAVVAEMVRRRLEETEGSSAYPRLPHHRVVTVGVAWLDPASGRFKLGTVGGEAMDERSHLEGFYRMLGEAKTAPRLVSWNGSGFDLPVMRYRSMLHGIAAPGLYRNGGDWKWDNYENRFHDMHVDLMDVLSGFGASRWVGLGMMSELLGLPSKSFLEGEVYEHVLGGEEEVVREYCKLDCLATLLVFLAWAVHRGELGPERLREHVEGIREQLAGEAFEGWRTVAERLADWPAWEMPVRVGSADAQEHEAQPSGMAIGSR